MYYNENTIIFLNGHFVKVKDAPVSIYNQTMHYGNGVFEGIRAYDTPNGVQIFKAKEHYDRLHYSAKVMHINLSYSSSELEQISYKLLEANNLKDAYIRPLVYLGENMSLTPTDEVNVVIMAWEWGKYLGDLEVKFNRRGEVTSWKGIPHAIDDQIQPDANFAKQLEKFSASLEVLRQTIIGKTLNPLEGSRDLVRTQETNLGNLITDAMLNKLRPDGAQIALLNSGGIRSSIPAGNISVSQVIEVMPFGNTIARLDLTGEQLKQALEHGVSQVELGEGRFPQVSGLRFIYDPKAPAGDRVISVTIVDQSGQEKPLDLTATYRVVANNFMSIGGDGYEVMKSGKNQVDTGFLLADVVIDYIKKQSEINVESGDRITAKE
jgi:5'-nucleotidase